MDGVLIRVVLAPNPGPMTGSGTNTYLLADGRGDVVVVDPGPVNAVHTEAILREAEPVGRIRAILVTHGHVDHAPGAEPLATATGAPIYGHPALVTATRRLQDRQVLEVGGIAVRAVDSPGHTDDSLSYWHAESRSLFTGDVVAGAGTVIVDDGPGGLRKYLASLERLARLGSSVLRPGHGPVVEDGPTWLRQYVEHRHFRETQVLEALLDRPDLSLEALLQVVYPEVLPVLRPMAARNLRAHLRKLDEEGRLPAETPVTALVGEVSR